MFCAVQQQNQKVLIPFCCSGYDWCDHYYYYYRSVSGAHWANKNWEKKVHKKWNGWIIQLCALFLMLRIQKSNRPKAHRIWRDFVHGFWNSQIFLVSHEFFHSTHALHQSPKSEFLFLYNTIFSFSNILLFNCLKMKIDLLLHSHFVFVSILFRHFSKSKFDYYYELIMVMEIRFI